MTNEESDAVQEQPLVDFDQPGSRIGANGESVERRAEGLMPMETVAKTLLVKANGLAAYQATTGMRRRSAD